MPKKRTNSVTIDDIARELGVANSTVSRALRDDPRISERVIEEVKRTAARMGYVPNIAARSLRTGRSNMIGLIVRDIRDSFSVETMRGVEEACAELDYGLLLCNSNDDLEKEQYYLRMLQQRRVDGVLLLTPTAPTPIHYLAVRQVMPLVLIDMEIGEVPLTAITVDHVMGGYLATKHLLDLGHRDIAFLSGPLHLSPCARMVQGYRQAMAEAGIPSAQHIVTIAQRTELEFGCSGMVDILRTHSQATAMATVSDLLASGALEAARQHNLRVPQDFSIVGYDDVPLASLLTPPLTTIAQDKMTLGSQAVSLLLDEINLSIEAPRQITLPPELVVRQSTSPPNTHSSSHEDCRQRSE
jgi:DNA-binding LacI/PurR family transcriptional regulator